ncbi:hypothetical protein D3C77_517090 [compost metagenome]
MQAGFDGKRCGGEDIPQHIGSIQLDVIPIAAVVRQMQPCTGECPCLLGQGQPLAQSGIAPRVGQHRRYRLALTHDLQLPFDQLGVVADIGAAAQPAAQQQGNPAPGPTVE